MQPEANETPSRLGQASSSTSAASPTSMATSLPDPSLPAPELPADEVGFTASDLIAQQARLEAQANEAIPFQFDACTYDRCSIRQPIYACKTCGGGGVCAGCSVSCHAEHDLVELFNKRKFRCDCGTPNLYRNKQPNDMGKVTKITGELTYPPSATPCTLRKPGFDPQNDENRYNHNFEGGFCYCERGQTYDAEKEDETMFQCIACEEWLHESCTSLRPSMRPSNKASQATAPLLQSEPEPSLIDHDLFDLMICDACVRQPGHEILRSYAGSNGWMVLVETRDAGHITEWDGINRIQVPTQQELDAAAVAGEGESWQIYGLPLEQEVLTQDKIAAAADDALFSSVAELARSTRPGDCTREGKMQQSDNKPADSIVSQDSLKRVASTTDSVEARANGKRPKTETGDVDSHAQVSASTSCRLPSPLPTIAKLSHSVTDDWKPAMCTEEGYDTAAQRYDVFLREDFRTRICRCEACLPKWTMLPHVLEAEETYAPPSDPHASAREDDNDDAASITSSTYDLGMAALRTMPREQMINSLHAYSKFRDALWEHLRPFAGSGKVVKEEDVRAFFQKTLQSNK